VEKGRVIGFLFQYEIFFEGRWMPAVRYDTSHGYAHKDLMNPDGSDVTLVTNNTTHDFSPDWSPRRLNGWFI
jgi:hypothetical protein